MLRPGGGIERTISNMNLLITAGNTQVPIDGVRVITNVFTGRTGAYLARAAAGRGHRVTVLTSNPEHLTGLPDDPDPERRTTVIPYRTYDDLASLFEHSVKSGGFDAIVHSAAVADFLVSGTYAAAPGTSFHPAGGTWHAPQGAPTLAPKTGGKIKSDEPELWLRLVRAPKLVDRVRDPWGYRGLLVKFKLESGVSDEELLKIAEASRRHSEATVMVANTLEAAGQSAFVGPLGFDGHYDKVSRRQLPDKLLDVLEGLSRKAESVHG